MNQERSVTIHLTPDESKHFHKFKRLTHRTFDDYGRVTVVVKMRRPLKRRLYEVGYKIAEGLDDFMRFLYWWATGKTVPSEYRPYRPQLK
ncbi:MAG: hypothetical protein JSS66_05675 [Armatimonadetes bacterium]|nr:hypothetical protein [Armatimonadota bacterium]